MIQEIFDELLNEKKVIYVDRLVWNFQEYSRCAQYLLDQEDLPVSSKIYQLIANSSLKMGSESSLDSKFFSEENPHELLELVVMKAAIEFFDFWKKLTTRPHIYALATVSSVSKYWWETLNRERSKALLERRFKEICAPYNYNPSRGKSYSISDSSDVIVGIAEFANNLYIATVKSNTIHVISVDFSVDKEIQIADLRRPGDVVVCGESKSLYVSDVEKRCIWRVDVSSSNEKPVNRFLETDYMPWTLSSQFSRLIVVAYGGSAIYIYSKDAELTRKIEMPNSIIASRAVETVDGNVLVCHSERWFDEKLPEKGLHQGVSEFSAGGEVLRHYKGVVKLREPYYMVMTSMKCVLVADRRNKVVVRLNSDLELEQLVLDEQKLAGQPFRMVYSEERGQLYVTYYDKQSSFKVDMYRI